MFWTRKKNLEENLEKIRKSLCCYRGSVCDCKYGASGDPHYSEQTGCPELRLVIEIINEMKDGEYSSFAKRCGALMT